MQLLFEVGVLALFAFNISVCVAGEYIKALTFFRKHACR